MLQITPQNKIFLAVRPVDFRNGIDGLVSLCRDHLAENPFSGSLFVFRNRKGTSIKILTYDGQGFWLCQKRFSEGKLKWWRNSINSKSVLSISQLQILLWNGNPLTAQIAPDWRAIE